MFKNIDFNKELVKTKLTIPVLALGGEHSSGLSPMHSFQQAATNLLGGVVKVAGISSKKNNRKKCQKEYWTFLVIRKRLSDKFTN